MAARDDRPLRRMLATAVGAHLMLCTGPKLVPRPAVRTAIWASMDMTGYFAAETVVMLAWVPTTAAVGMK
jgi:hypothetical protein